MDDDGMDLPEGRTCGDCFAFRYCSGTMIHCKPTNTRCDWAPSRFHVASAVLAAEAAKGNDDG